VASSAFETGGEEHMSEKTWSRSDDWVGTEVDGSYVMVNVETGKYVALNETAHAVWQALENDADESAIAQYLLQRFDVPSETCGAAIAESLSTMQDMSLVTSAS
jgi:hypothetical protein